MIRETGTPTIDACVDNYHRLSSHPAFLKNGERGSSFSLNHIESQPQKAPAMQPILLPVSELKSALTGLSKIQPAKNSLPILQHLKVERTREGWITLTKTDLDSFATVRLEQPSSGEPQSFLVPFDALAALLKRSSPKDTLILGQNPDRSLSLQSTSAGETKIQPLPVQDFPMIPRIGTPAVIVPAALRHSMQEAFECTSVDPTRFVLNGAFLDVSQPQAHIIATDGRHMYNSNSFTVPIRESIIIPRSKFLLWHGFGADGEWQLKLAEKKDAHSHVFVQFSSRRWRFITKAIDGQYPNWRQVLVNPASIKTLLTIDPQKVESLMGKIDALPCHNSEHFPVGLELVNGRLSLLAKAPEAKTWEKQLFDHVKVSGPDVTVFLNRHLLLKALRFGLLDIGIADSISPLRLSHAGREMVIMPCRADLENRSTPSGLRTNSRREASTPSPAPRPRRQSQVALASDVFTGIKDSFRSGLGILKSLASNLKEATRTLKANEREMKTKMRQLRNPRAQISPCSNPNP